MQSANPISWPKLLEYDGKYQTSFFTNLADLTPTTDHMRLLLDAFAPYNLLPTTVTQLVIPANSRAQRFRCATPDGAWVMDFEPKRLVITQNSLADKPPLDPVSVFTDTATKYIHKFLELFPRKQASRLSLVTEGLLYGDSEKHLAAHFSSLFRALPFYSKGVVTEWGCRFVTRNVCSFGDKAEEINVITQLNRARYSISGTDSPDNDRVQVEFDINTYQGHLEERFKTEDVPAFFAAALGLRHTLMCELEKHLGDHTKQPAGSF